MWGFNMAIEVTCVVFGCGTPSVEGGRCLKHPPKRKWEGAPSNKERGLPSDWGVRRRRVLNKARDAQGTPRCNACKSREAGEVDHVTPVFEGGGHGYDNLVALCIICHAKKSAKEAARNRIY